ncbi:MAG: preprotein translocase subunit SecD, partial [Nanoarchaeota archaeon]
LQTVLVTGSLPAKIKIVRADTISPKLGDSFTNNALFMAGLSILAVVAVLIIRYRRLMLAVPIVLTSVAEVLLTLGSYALFGWSFDLAAVAGIIVAVGTGVNDQIVITDETLRKDLQHGGGWTERLKRAFFIIMAAYFTALVSMVPLLFAGAGMLRGFAITTIVGITFGVFVTRPAFGKLVEILLER